MQTALRPLDQSRVSRHLVYMLIYKILRAEEWAALDSLGETKGAPVDIADGYIHFSTADQAVETVSKHFAGIDGLILAVFDTENISGDLKWEPSRGGALFPHLYAPLRRADVKKQASIPFQNGSHDLSGLLN
jgi:uncharacterized protein (DUF952 family)